MLSLPIDIQALIARFDDPAAKALVVLGSHTRGEAGPFSDVDLFRIFPVGDPHSGQNTTYLIDDHLVVVSDVDLNRVEQWFTHPHLAVLTIGGLREGVALIDRENTFAAIKARALDFTWDAEFQQRGDRWAAEQLVDCIEEVHKALNGLRRGDEGKLLAARHSLSWTLLRIVHVHRGILPRSDRDVFDAAIRLVGEESPWTIALRGAFGIGQRSSLAEQLTAGLQLYVLTAEMIVRDPQHASLIQQTVARIEAAVLQ